MYNVNAKDPKTFDDFICAEYKNKNKSKLINISSWKKYSTPAIHIKMKYFNEWSQDRSKVTLLNVFFFLFEFVVYLL